jgi:N6-adenosine-specific RNA methylase IME4
MAPAAALRVHPSCALVPEMPERQYRALRDDIERRRIQTPLEITAADEVVNGQYRLRAAIELGHPLVPVREVDVADPDEHVLAAAIRQRWLTESQRAALALDLEQMQLTREQARQRQRANLKGQPRAEVANLPPRGRTRDHAAALAGVSARTVQAAETVRQRDPNLFAAIKAGRLPAYRALQELERKEREAKLGEPPPLPQGAFEVIYADPPWQLGSPYSSRAPENHYRTLPLAALAELEPPAAKDSLLFLWAVNCRLPQALELIQHWRFEYLTDLAWVKPNYGLGHWTRTQHELLLLARRGHVSPPPPERRPSSVIRGPRRKHSQKPAIAYALIERMYPQASKLELFARGRPRPGWTAWGDEVSDH